MPTGAAITPEPAVNAFEPMSSPTLACICAIRLSTALSSVTDDVDELIADSTYELMTSICSKEASNLSMTCPIFSTSIVASILSIPETTPPICFVTAFILRAPSTREATASSRLDNRR